ncbi:glycosyl transferase family 2 [Wenzhouxiangella limi]|uniref:Glycosyl transferase family 2 n=1 Tax=Wenzhouxiangella limi TaxID=2707351 RepID=A0A845V1F0_9GAMM|nr:glycosyl transferase family 2 [Wenzhouxiangella limi]NDY96908.1 glycosyl transferase family 2 [Wenzhouxiangella limi]
MRAMLGDRPAGLQVIIPAGPAEVSWRGLLEQLPPAWPVCISAVEERPAGLPDRINWLQGPAGRGLQLNAAASASRARWLWFLHADSILTEPALVQVQRLTCGTEAVLAYLDLAFLPDGPKQTALNAIGANLRSRLLGLPYGDQGLCLPAEDFRRLGGFRTDLARGEDLDFVVRARAAGLPLRRLPARIYTSARRYREQGWWKTSWRHQVNAWRLTRAARAGRRRPESE